MGKHGEEAEYAYSIDECEIPPTECCKDLGIYVSSNLSFKKHYSHIIRRASFRLRQLNIVFNVEIGKSKCT